MWIAYAFMLFVTILKQFEEGKMYHIISRLCRKGGFKNVQTHINDKGIISNTL